MFEIDGSRSRQIISIGPHPAKGVAVFVIRKPKFFVQSSSSFLIRSAIDPFLAGHERPLHEPAFVFDLITGNGAELLRTASVHFASGNGFRTGICDDSRSDRGRWLWSLGILTKGRILRPVPS